jgi:hypothetical protein
MRGTCSPRREVCMVSLKQFGDKKGREKGQVKKTKSTVFN